MFTNQNLEDLQYILDLKNDESSLSLSDIGSNALNVYKKRMTFFKPYEDPKDFLAEFLAIIRYPLAFSLGAVVAAFNTAVSTCYLVGLTIASVGALLFLEDRDEIFNEMGKALNETGMYLVLTASSLLLAVLSIPNNVASFVFRALATAFPSLAKEYDGQEFLPV